MLSQFDNSLNASVFLWAQNRLLQKAQAYIPVTTRLYYTPDPTLPPGYLGYSSPFKGWVYDSSISGAFVINSISGGGFSSPLTRASGIHIDYPNGRVIVPAAWGVNRVFTGTACLCEINCYLPNEYDDMFVTAAKAFRNPRFNGVPNSGIAPGLLCSPAMFINTLHDNLTPFALGGLDNSKTTFSFVTLVESDYQLKACLSLFRDSRYSYIPLLSIAQDPLNGFGDLKSGIPYNYQSLIEQYGTPGNLIYIETARASKVSDRIKLNPMLFAGVIDLDVSFIRQAT